VVQVRKKFSFGLTLAEGKKVPRVELHTANRVSTNVVRCSETNRKRSTDVVTISDCPDRKDLADDNDWRGLIIRWFVWRVADLNDRVPVGGLTGCGGLLRGFVGGAL
jgi:hypothetical protein